MRPVGEFALSASLHSPFIGLLPVDVLLRTFDERFGGYRALAVHYVWEDLFWRWKHERVAWLDRLIRL